MKGKNNLRMIQRTGMVIVMALMLAVFVTNNLFADHWASKEISDWKAKGLLNGDQSANFREDEPITRAEFMALINRMEGFTEKSDGVDAFEDVTSKDWYYEVVSIALKAGYINGTSEKTMSPNSKITREEAMTILSRLSKVEKNSESYKKASDYLEVSDWAKEAVSTCISNGFIAGDMGKIKPLFHITRAEAVVMLDRKLSDTRMFAFEGDYDLKNTKVKNIEILAKGVNLKNIQVSGKVSIGKQVDGKVKLEGSVETLVNKAKGTEIEFHGSIATLDLEKDGKLLGEAKVERLILEKEAKLILQDQSGNTRVIKDNSEKIDLTSQTSQKDKDKKDLKKPENKNDKKGKQGAFAPPSVGGSSASSGTSSSGSSSGSSSSNSGSSSVDKDTKNPGTVPNNENQGDKDQGPEGKTPGKGDQDHKDQGSEGKTPGKEDSSGNAQLPLPKAEALKIKLEKVEGGVKLSVGTSLTEGNHYVLVKNAKEEILAKDVNKDSEVQGEIVENLEAVLGDLKPGSWVLLYEVRVEDGKNKVQKLGATKVTGDLLGSEKVEQIESANIAAKRGTTVNGSILMLPDIAPENKYMFKKNLSEDEADLDKIYKNELISEAEDYVAEENIPGIQQDTYILVYEVNKKNEIQKAGRIQISKEMLGEAAEQFTEIDLSKGGHANTIKIIKIAEEKAHMNKYVVSVEEKDVKLGEIVKNSTLNIDENKHIENFKPDATIIPNIKVGQYIVLYEVDSSNKIIKVGKVQVKLGDIDEDGSKLPEPKVEKGSQSGHTKITFSNFNIGEENTVVYEVKGVEGKGYPVGYPIDDSMSVDKYIPFENGKDIKVQQAGLWVTIYERNKENELVRYISIQIPDDKIKE